MAIDVGVCAYCGKSFKYNLREDGKGYLKRKYCSDDCMKAKNAKDLEKYAWATCEYCGKKFKREKKKCGRGYKNKKFCSIACENKHHREVSEQNYGWGTCIVCGKKFKRERVSTGYYSQSQFCSEACKEKFADIKYPKRIQNCLYCGKRIEYKTKREDGSTYYKTKNKFCSLDCEHNYMFNVYGKKICKKCGKEFNRPTFIDYRGQRQYKRGYKYDYCENCRVNLPRSSEAEQEFAAVLQQNHIDYDNTEFRIDNTYYDFHITNFNILIDVNPSFTHTIKETYFGRGKTKNYHYDRIELAAKYGYVCLCVWEWSDIDKLISLLKILMKTNKKYKMVKHNQPKLLYYCKQTKSLLEKEEAIKYLENDKWSCYPVYNCGSYVYEGVDFTFDNE